MISLNPKLLFQLKVLIIDFLVVYPGHSTGIAQGKMKVMESKSLLYT